MAQQIEEVVEIAKKTFSKMVLRGCPVSNFVDADDVAQNVAIACLQGFQNAALRTKYEIYNSRRTGRSTAAREQAVGLDRPRFSMDSDAAEVWEEVATLPPVAAEIVRLRFQDGLSMTAISRLTGWPVAEIAKSIKGSLEFLRGKLS